MSRGCCPKRTSCGGTFELPWCLFTYVDGKVRLCAAFASEPEAVAWYRANRGDYPNGLVLPLNVTGYGCCVSSLAARVAGASAMTECREFVARRVHGLRPKEHTEALRELSRTFGEWADVVETENDQRGVSE